MNIALHNVKGDECYIASLKMAANADGYIVLRKRVKAGLSGATRCAAILKTTLTTVGA